MCTGKQTSIGNGFRCCFCTCRLGSLLTQSVNMQTLTNSLGPVTHRIVSDLEEMLIWDDGWFYCKSICCCYIAYIIIRSIGEIQPDAAFRCHDLTSPHLYVPTIKHEHKVLLIKVGSLTSGRTHELRSESDMRSVHQLCESHSHDNSPLK